MRNFRNESRLIVIEGPDGIGKSTQASRLLFNLQKIGKKATLISFPGKGASPIERLIVDFLKGRFGEVSPEFLSLAFSLDRLRLKEDINTSLDEGYIVICDRYTKSNISFQSSKTEDWARKKFIEELINYNEKVLIKIPNPDLEIILTAPDEHFKSSEHLKRSDSPDRDYLDGGLDIHEQSTGLQLSVNKYYSSITSEKNMRFINAYSSDLKRKSIEDIELEILNIIVE